MSAAPGTGAALAAPGAKAYGALAALGVATFGYVTAETLPIGLLLPIAGDLHTSASSVGLLVTWYGLVVVLTSVPLTHLTRRVPRRALLCALLAGFVVTSAASAAATGYPVLLALRILTAISQAVFWSIVVPAAAALAPPGARGRAVSIVFAGSSLAAVLGVPAGTWLGQVTGWRTSFLALAAVGAVGLAGVARLLPAGPPPPVPQPRSARGRADARQYVRLVVVAVLATTGSFVVFTYITPFLTTVAALPASAVGPVLLVRGLAGVAGVAAGGPLADRRPRLALAAPVAAQALAFAGMFWAPRLGTAATVASVAVSGLAFAVFTTAMSAWVLRVAPGSADLAAAGTSTAVNVGITGGAYAGSLLLPTDGARGTALVGALLSLAGLASLAAPVGRPGARVSGPEASATRRASDRRVLRG